MSESESPAGNINLNSDITFDTDINSPTFGKVISNIVGEDINQIITKGIDEFYLYEEIAKLKE